MLGPVEIVAHIDTVAVPFHPNTENRSVTPSHAQSDHYPSLVTAPSKGRTLGRHSGSVLGIRLRQTSTSRHPREFLVAVQVPDSPVTEMTSADSLSTPGTQRNRLAPKWRHRPPSESSLRTSSSPSVCSRTGQPAKSEARSRPSSRPSPRSPTVSFKSY